MNTRTEPIKLVRMMGAIFIIAGTGILIWHILILVNALNSANWPTAPGKIISSEVVSRRDQDSTTMYYAEVKYSYAVEQRTYTGNRVSFVNFGTNHSRDARHIVGRFPAGVKVSVRYNPDEPSESVLESRVSWLVYLFMGVGVAFTGFGILLCGLKGVSRGSPSRTFPEDIATLQ